MNFSTLITLDGSLMQLGLTQFNTPRPDVLAGFIVTIKGIPTVLRVYAARRNFIIEEDTPEFDWTQPEMPAIIAGLEQLAIPIAASVCDIQEGSLRVTLRNFRKPQALIEGADEVTILQIPEFA